MIRLSNPNFKLDVLPKFGARWIRLRAHTSEGWRDILWPGPSMLRPDKNPLLGGAFLMAPWCNRVPGGKFMFKREGFRLKPNFPDGSAIHGDIYSRPWRVVSRSATSLVMAIDSRNFPDFNFPFDLRFGHRIRLAGPRIESSLAVMNVGGDPAPVGLGFHPFFRRKLTPHSEPPLITIPATRYFPSVNAIPTGMAKAVNQQTDARFPVSLSDRDFDFGYTGFRGRPASLYYPTEKIEVWLLPGHDMRHLYVWAPQTFEGKPAPFACIEPMSMTVNGLTRLADNTLDSGVQILRSRERFSVSWSIEVGERH